MSGNASSFGGGDAMDPFATFMCFYIPMGFVIGFAAAAIGASPWPFVIPVVLSFSVFSEFTSIFDAIVLSITMDLFNAVFLTYVYHRSPLVTVHVKQGLMIGVIAAVPAVPAAFLAQEILPGLQDLLRDASGAGLFLFSIIFFVKGRKTAKLKSEKEADPMQQSLEMVQDGDGDLLPASGDPTSSPAERRSADRRSEDGDAQLPVNVDVDGSDPSQIALDMEEQDDPEPGTIAAAMQPFEREALTAPKRPRERSLETGLTAPKHSPAGLRSAAEQSPSLDKGASCEEMASGGFSIRMALSPAGAKEPMETKKLIISVLVYVVTGGLAGFIGFGGGILFATINVIFFGYEVSTGTGTACLSTSVLMLAVNLSFIPSWNGAIFKYCVVGVLASLTGAVVGAKTAQKLGLVQIYIFVGTTLLVCGVIATIPMFLK